MRYLFFDCQCGISGDMILGALTSLGVDAGVLREELGKLHLTGYRLEAEEVTRRKVAAAKVDVRVEEDRQPHRGLKEIQSIVSESALSYQLTRLCAARSVCRRKRPNFSVLISICVTYARNP